MPVSWETMYAERTCSMKGSGIREFFKLTEQPEVMSFAGGFPSAECFPQEAIGQALQALAMQQGASSLQYGPTEGNWQLRSMLADKMSKEGIYAAADNILITNGSQQGLDLIGKVLLNPGDYAVVEEPGYVGGLGAINNYQGSIIPIPIDEEGLSVEMLAAKLQQMEGEGGRVKLAYVVPNFQNPTGVTMSLERRRRLLELACRYDFLIIEDNPYGELCYEGEQLPSIKSMDSEGRVIYLGSFSKVFIPGIRVAWIVADDMLMEKLITAKQSTDLCSNTLGQHLVLSFSVGGCLGEHVSRINSYYRYKRDLMLAAMEEHFPPVVKWTRPRGGFFVWVTFPDGFSAKCLLLKALEEKKVAYVDGSCFYVNGNGKNTARFSFSEASPEKIREGIARLGQLLHKEMATVPDTGTVLLSGAGQRVAGHGAGSPVR